MKTFSTLFFALCLCACVAGGTSVQSVDGMVLRVMTDDSYFWPETTTTPGADGQSILIDVFPLVTALVVTRRDGGELGRTDEARARAAATAHCAALGRTGPPSGSTSADSRLAAGAWAFFPCGAAG